MTQPLIIDPGDLVKTMNGHAVLIDQYGRAIADLGTVPNPVGSGAGVMSMNGALAALTAAMQGQLAQHGINLMQNAQQYGTAEQGNASTLTPPKPDVGPAKDAIGIVTSSAIKDPLGVFTSLLGTMGSTGASAIGSAINAGVSAVGTTTNTAVSMAATGAKAAPVSYVDSPSATPTSGTPVAAAPAAGGGDSNSKGGQQGATV
jgi:hypothetical protein